MLRNLERDREILRCAKRGAASGLITGALASAGYLTERFLNHDKPLDHTSIAIGAAIVFSSTIAGGIAGSLYGFFHNRNRPEVIPLLPIIAPPTNVNIV